ncbi:hypothetical protein, partial [Ulvibacterium sp.]|uniref:hypothetical protein n=1 Tax=Ulvibacterium sp. TaxID=2665914 RepID=UPI002635A2D4
MNMILSYFLRKSLLAISVLTAFYGFAQTQENPYNQKILGKLASYAMKHSPEKVYVHTDKSIY